MKNRSIYQKKIVAQILAAFEKARRGRVCWPCGTGKTHLGFMVAQHYNCTLIMVPTLALVAQWIKEEQFTGSILCVCSKDERDEKDAAEIPVELTTEPAAIKAFMKRPNPKTVFATYQSSRALTAGCKGQKFELAIFDEAHRTAGMADVYGMALHDKNVRVKHRLFLTATERRYRGNKNGVVSMCDEKLYGESIDFLSFKQVIEWDWLCDYDVALPEILDSDVLDIEGDEDAIIKAGGVLIKKVMKERKLKKGFVFWSSRVRSRQFTEAANRMGVKTFHIDGSMDTDERNAIWAAYKKCPKALLSNVRVLGEGINFTACDLVMFGDPRNSTVDIVQAAGRCLRKDKANPKKRACIVIPLIVGEDAEANANMQFERCHGVLSELGAMDSRLIDYIKFHASRPGSRPEPPPASWPRILCSDGFLSNASEKIKVKYLDRMRGLVPFLPVEEFLKEFRDSGIIIYLAGKPRPRGDSYVEQYKHHSGWPSDPRAVYDMTWPQILGKHEKLSADVFAREFQASGVSVLDYPGEYRKHAGWPACPTSYYKMKWTQLLGKAERCTSPMPKDDLLDLCRKAHKTKGGRWSDAAYGDFCDASKDPRMPRNFRTAYDNWRGWDVEMYGEKYTYTETRDICIANGALESRNLADWYKKFRAASCDCRLVANPAEDFPGFPGWPAFLGRENKSRTNQRRKAISLRDLQAEAKSDYRIVTRKTYLQFKRPHWPVRPEEKYVDEWPGWAAFLGKETSPGENHEEDYY